MIKLKKLNKYKKSVDEINDICKQIVAASTDISSKLETLINKKNSDITEKVCDTVDEILDEIKKQAKDGTTINDLNDLINDDEDEEAEEDEVVEEIKPKKAKEKKKKDKSKKLKVKLKKEKSAKEENDSEDVKEEEDKKVNTTESAEPVKESSVDEASSEKVVEEKESAAETEPVKKEEVKNPTSSKKHSGISFIYNDGKPDAFVQLFNVVTTEKDLLDFASQGIMQLPGLVDPMKLREQFKNAERKEGSKVSIAISKHVICDFGYNKDTDEFVLESMAASKIKYVSNKVLHANITDARMIMSEFGFDDFAKDSLMADSDAGILLYVYTIPSDTTPGVVVVSADVSKKSIDFMITTDTDELKDILKK